MTQSIRTSIFKIIAVVDYDNRMSRSFNIVMIGLISINIAAILLESMHALSSRFTEQFATLEKISIALFSLEYILRLWTCPESNSDGYQKPLLGRLRFMLTPLMLTDLVAILPFYLNTTWTFDTRILRFLRLLWIFRITHHSRPLQMLSMVIKRERKTLAAIFLIMGIILVLISAIIYSIEHLHQPDAFSSIPQAMWWSMATLTTVGYGDVVPQTALGKLFGLLVMFIGIGMFAVPTGILISSFSQELKRKDFITIWDMIAQVPLFSHLSANEIAAITDLLRLRTAIPGEIIFQQGDQPDSMYFIVKGEVEFNLQPQPLRRRGGDFFGELGILYKTPRTATATAQTVVELLRLDARDIETFLLSNPMIRQKITQEAELRMNQTHSSIKKTSPSHSIGHCTGK